MRHRSVLSLVVLLALLFFSINRLLFFSAGSVERLFSFITYPFLQIQRLVDELHVQYRHERLSAAQLRMQVYALQAERDILFKELISVRAQRVFLDEIDEVRSFRSRYETDFAHCVRILSRTSTTGKQAMYIDAGSLQGIEVDMVGVYQNQLIGRVCAVYPTYSELLLITDRSCKIAAACVQTGICGIHEGIDAGCVLSHVSHLETPVLGDMVISSGQGMVFPQGFGLGTLRGIECAGVTYILTVSSLVDISTISHCYIIKKGAYTVSIT